MSIKYKWITVKDAVELVLSDKFDEGGSLDFTLDSYKYDGDNPDFVPTGWYGMARTGIFDGAAIVMGYHGGGIDRVVNCDHLKDEYQETFEDVLFAFLSYLNAEGYGSWTPNTMICIDANYPNEY